MTFSIHDEHSTLETVIIGAGSPYQRDKAKVAAQLSEFPLLPDTPRRADVLAMRYPTEAILEREYAAFTSVLAAHAIDVLRPDPDAAYSFDYTCPRDIGFVIGNTFFVANMAVKSRADEIQTIEAHLRDVDRAEIVRLPPQCALEGGDVIVLDRDTVLTGFNQRSNRVGVTFLRQYLAPRGITVLPVPHKRLHLDCCLNPLGLGHLLIHPESLDGVCEPSLRVLERYPWVRIDSSECEHLATNVLSIAPTTLLARNHAACARVNRELTTLGYRVESLDFDGVPATGGSFRCASLPLSRRADQHI